MAISISSRTAPGKTRDNQRRHAPSAAMAFAGAFALMMTAHCRSALAQCAVTPAGSVTCSSTNTTNTTNIDGAVGASVDREQQFNNGANIAGQVLVGQTVNQSGLALNNTFAGGSVSINNLGAVILTNLVSAGAPAGLEAALNLTANGGNASYTGNGGTVSAGATIDYGLVLFTTGAGAVNVGSSGAPVTGGSFLGAFGLLTQTGAGTASIFLSGGTVTATVPGDDAIHAINATGGDFDLTLTGGVKIENGSGGVNDVYGIGAADITVGSPLNTFGPGNVNIISNADIGAVGPAMVQGISIGSTTPLTGNINVELTGGTIDYTGIGVNLATAGSIVVTMDAGSVLTAIGGSAGSTGIRVASTSGAATVNVNGTIDAPDVGVAGAPTVNMGATGVVDANDIGIQANAVGGGAVNVTSLTGSAINQGNGVGGSAQNTNVAAPLGGIITSATTGATVVNVGGSVSANAFGISSTSGGGPINVTTGGGAITGSTGISLNTTLTGATGGTIAFVGGSGAIFGTGGDAIVTLANTGATSITVNGPVTATGAGNSGISATSLATGPIFVSVAGGASVVDATGIGVSLSTGAGTGAATLSSNGAINGLGSFANPTTLVTNNNTAASPVTIDNGGVIANAANSPTGWSVVATGPGGTAPGGTPTNLQPVIVDNSGLIVGRIQLGGGVDQFNNIANGVWNVSGAANQLGNGSTISNAAGGTINIGTGPGSATAFTFTNISGAQTATDTVSNAGLINSTGAVTFTFDPASAVINNSGVFNVGSVPGSPTESTAFNSGGVQTVNNTGTFNLIGLVPQTGTYAGTLSFTGAGGSQFNNAGGVINMRGDGGAPTNAVTLNSTLSGASDLNYTYTWGPLATSSYNFAGGPGSQLKVDAFLGGPGSTSDRLVIGGNVTGVTQIQVNNVNPGAGALNFTGITVVAVQGTGSNNFVVSPTSPNFANFGPLGAVSNGAFIDPLLYVAGGAASANGQPNGNAYKLFSLPGPFLTQLPLAATAAQNIWQQTASNWEDRQEELRSYFGCGVTASAQAYGGGATKKSAPPPPAGCSGTPAVWLKAVASGTDFRDQENLGRALNNPMFDGVGWSNSYQQDTFGVVGGVDGGKSRVLSPTDSIVFGLMGGYLGSQVSFNSPNAPGGAPSLTGFNFTGGTVGVSADYMNGGFFIDALAKADFMNLNISGIPGGVLGGGTSTQNIRSNTYGVLDNVGYRFEHGQFFVEPIGTLQYIDARLGNLALAGAGINANFGRGDAFDIAGGVRAGSTVMDDRVHYLEAAVTAKVWDPVSVDNIVNFTSLPGTAFPLTANFTDPYGEIGLQLDWINRGASGWSAFAKADAQFNQQFVTLTAKAGVTYGF